MAKIKFTDPEVDSRFEALAEKDRMVELPGTYAGKFSNITRAMAAKMVRQGSNLLKAKDGVKDDEVKSEKPAAEKPAEGKEKAVPGK